jgi:hypothetical protein
MKGILLILLIFISAIHSQLYLQFGDNVSPTVKNSITNLFEDFNYTVISSNTFINVTTLAKNISLISFGNSSTSSQLIKSNELSQLGSEGFIVRSSTSIYGGNVIGCDGNKDYKALFNITYSIGGQYKILKILFNIIQLYYEYIQHIFALTV